MRVPRGERTLATLLIVPTVLVVLLLGIVQYRWSADVSNATSLRLADSLQMSMMSWQLNLFRDLADVCLRLRLDGDSIAGSDLEQGVQRFQTRQRSAEYPDLVAGIHLMASDPALPLLAWNPATLRFRPVPGKPAFGPLRHQVSVAAPEWSARSVGDVGALVYTPGDLAEWRFSAELPGVLRQLTTDRALFDALSPKGMTASAWLVIDFDLDVLSMRVLPLLASRYFTGPDGLDYEVALVGGQPRRVLYSSDATFAVTDPPDADGRMNLFGRSVDGANGSAIRVFHSQAGTSAPPIPVSTAWLPLVGEAPRDADWQLIVRHRRGGALGAFVEAVSRRNLAISFGLLLLLVISVAVWIIIGNRVRRLARIEMNFVTAVSHDLRTPIAIISSAADNISQGVVRDQGQLSQYGAAIGTQAKKLSELVEQVLLFGSVRQPSNRYVPRPIDVSEVIETTLAASDQLIRAARVTVERDIADGLPRVMSDSVGLSQCLQNLITNALKYGGDRRWLGISAVLSDDGESEVQLSVRDRGIGIAPADLRYVFEPFYRSPTVVATKIQGTGLGLAVATSVAKAMGSRLTVMSAPGEGSTFTLHLPVAPEDAR